MQKNKKPDLHFFGVTNAQALEITGPEGFLIVHGVEMVNNKGKTSKKVVFSTSTQAVLMVHYVMLYQVIFE